MPLTVINDSLNGRWVYYRVAGLSKKMFFKPNETRTIPDINSVSELTNAVSIRKAEIAAKLPQESLRKDLFDVGGNYFRAIEESGCVSIFVVPNENSIQFNDESGESNQSLQAPYNAAQEIGTSDYTVSVRFKIPSSATTNQSIYYQRNTANNSGLSILWSNIGGGRVSLQFTKNPGTPVLSYTIAGVPNDDNWNHIIWTNDRDVGTLGYLNGEGGTLLTSTNEFSGFSLSHSNEPLIIGNNNINSIPFRGRIDEFILMKRALSQSQATTLYNCGQAINPINAFGDVVAWYRMGDGDTFPTITDQSGNQDGTLQNMTADDIKADTAQNPA